MKLWVLRHGEAVPHGSRPHDSERELTDNGRKEVLRSAALLIGKPLTAIYASPYLRAQQTAQLVRETLGFEPEIRTVEWLTPDTEPDKVAEQMVAVSDVLLVSHNPLVGNLLSYLQHGAGYPSEKVSTAGLAELESNELLVGSMRLNSIKHP
ncbi:phosphohistidine phosphatase SixA [Pseudomonas sp. QLc11A]|jgi:phosphohistidine phosphatase|uniref:Phosphohistidine phosphatase SixA n=1 Tax=Pseudomonas azerbaijanorientalis TaxID=2842350 RepID=A0ABW8W011_9PSED|nr:phosphohistidine phosphatase SixA [Pseudomonas azerbaijanorientalis]QXH60780.1 phosphohistidine phosphatase SixA [Pseudomonas azerbaijanorientalis]